MGKKRRSEDEAPLFFTRFFEECGVDGVVEMRAIPNKGAKAPIHREFVTTPSEFGDFAAAYGGKDSQHGVYFGPAKRRDDTDGTKNGVAESHVLWTEIDTDKAGWDAVEVAKFIHELPGCLQPSCCVLSGHGVHLYWYLEDAIPSVGVENCNRVLGYTFRGDKVHNVDRIMRVPGTFNTKGKPVFCRVLWNYFWSRTDANELLDTIKDFGRVLADDGWITVDESEKREATRRANNNDEAKVYAMAYDDRRRTANSVGLNAFDVCVYGGGPNAIGLDEAILLYTAAKYCRGHDVEAIVTDTLRQVQNVHAEQAKHERWDWVDEERNIRKKLMRWVRRWDQISSTQKLKKHRGTKNNGKTAGIR